MRNREKLKLFDHQIDVSNRLDNTSSVRVHVQIAQGRSASLQSVPLN